MKGSMDPQGTLWYGILGGFPGDITVLSTLTTLSYNNGTEAQVGNGVYNHHIAIADMSKKAVLLTACPGAKPASSLPLPIFAGVGEDHGKYIYSTQDPKFNGGYYLGQ